MDMLNEKLSRKYVDLISMELLLRTKEKKNAEYGNRMNMMIRIFISLVTQLA